MPNQEATSPLETRAVIQKERKVSFNTLAGTFFLCAASIVISLTQVTVNKVLFDSFGFQERISTLTAIHLCATYSVIRIFSLFRSVQPKMLSVRKRAEIGSLYALSLVLTNMSLAYNSVGLYQISKLCITPCTIIIRRVFYQKSTTEEMQLALTLVVLGSFIASCTDFTLRTSSLGLLSILVSVPAASLAQVWCQVYQEGHMSSVQLLLNWTPSAALVLFLIAPITDKGAPRLVFSGRHLYEIIFDQQAAWLILSAGSAVLVNLSGHLVIGRLSALGFQVLGCFKTALIVAAGVLFFHDPYSTKTVFGVTMALFGTTWYSRAANHAVNYFSITQQRTCTLLLLLSVPFIVSWTGLKPREEPQVWDLIVCGHARMEAHILASWVLWNNVAGIQHFVLFDNNDVSETGQKDEFDRAVEPFVRLGLVTVHKYHRDVVNNLSLADTHNLNRTDYETLKITEGENFLKDRCYDMYHKRSRWLAFLDTDEVFVKIQDESLREYLLRPEINDNLRIGSVVFQWRIASYSSHFLRPKADDAFESYKLCDHHPSNLHVKSIVRGTRGMQNTSIRPLQIIQNAHWVVLNPGYECVSGFEDGFGCDISVLQQMDRVHELFQINHYFSRSLEDFFIKAQRGVTFLDSTNIMRNGLDFVHHSHCLSVENNATRRALMMVSDLRKRLGIPRSPDLRLSGIENPYSPSSVEHLLFRSISSGLEWDEEFYFSRNANNSSCRPNPPQDGLLHFWVEGYKAGCLHRFKRPQDSVVPITSPKTLGGS